MEYTLFKDTYVMYQLLEFINESSIVALWMASKKLNEICKNYIELEDDERFEIIVNNDKYDNSILLQNYCKNNDLIKIRKMIKLDINLYWNWGLWGASKGGHINIINLMIEKGADHLNGGLYDACFGGHIDIVELMIKKGANQWDGGLRRACSGSHIDIVKLMIEKGADHWDSGLHNACEGDHIDIVKLMIEKGATRCGSGYRCNKSMEEHLKKINNK